MRFFVDVQERYFIIGRVYEDKKLVGFKVYAANQKKVLGLVSKELAFNDLREAKRTGKELVVVGLSVSNAGAITHMRNASFNLNKLDKVDGKGRPIKELGNYILISFSGFDENRKYRLINSNGYERIEPLEEFVALVNEGKVNGATRSPRNVDKIILYKHCDYRENGFEKIEN